MNEITIRQVMLSLREKSPGFSQVIDRLIREYGEDEIDWDTYVEEYGGIYFVFNELAKYLETLLKIKQTDEIQQIFDLVEIWHTNGDYAVQEAATVGLLEDIISLNPEHSLAEEPFFDFMGEEARFWAEKVKVFWKDGTIISDDRGV